MSHLIESRTSPCFMRSASSEHQHCEHTREHTRFYRFDGIGHRGVPRDLTAAALGIIDGVPCVRADRRLPLIVFDGVGGKVWVLILLFIVVFNSSLNKDATSASCISLCIAFVGEHHAPPLNGALSSPSSSFDFTQLPSRRTVITLHCLNACSTYILTDSCVQSISITIVIRRSL